MAKSKKYVLLFLIVALGFFLRFVNIENAPPGVYPDEAVNGIDALNAIHYGNWQWFYEANNGREGFFMNMIAVCFKLFGVTVLSLKLPSIIFGTLTILGTYLLAKELYKKDRFALISAFLVSTAFWAINFSRISFRANTLPTVLVFSFYFLMRGVRTRKWWDFAAGGLIFGLGLHTYIAFRIAPLILIVMLVTLMITRERFLREYWKYIFVFIIFTTVAAAPMLYTFYVHPEYIQSRTGNVSVLNPEVNQGHLVKAFLKSFWLSIAKYNIWGDQNWRHNYPPYPLLDPITGIAFMFGFIYAIGRLFHLLTIRFVKKVRSERLEVYMLLLSWFFVMLVPEFMTAEGNPHALRAIGTLPPVFIFATLTFEYFFRKAEKHSYLFKKVTTSLIVAMIIVIGVFNIVKYHFVWAKQPEVAQSFDKNIMEVSNYIKSQPKDKEIFIVIESMQRIPLQVFNWDAPNIFYYYPGEIDQIEPKSKNFEIIMTDRSDEIIDSLAIRFPQLQFQEVKNDKGMSYFIFK
jgi:4-amino-4-deoxy-L-arabinose transferase-like glycosyltransferase